MNEMNQKFCQCCGMPMGDTDELYGTNGDGSKNEGTWLIPKNIEKSIDGRTKQSKQEI